MTDISIVICSHQRPDDLTRCLEAISSAHLTLPVIVVDSASSPRLEAVATSFSDRLPGLVYHYESRPGLSRARNAGLSLAQTTWVAFIDDDARVRGDWLEQLTPALDSSAWVVGGQAVADFPSPPPRWLSSRLLQYSGITRYPEVAARPIADRHEFPVGANLCVRRGEILALGGFPEHLGRIGDSLLSGEETVVLDAVRAGGGEIWIAPGAIVDHRVSPARYESRYYWRRLWWQGITRARIGGGPRTALRLILAAPVRALLWVVTRDRFYLYRLAETGGYLACAIGMITPDPPG